MLPGLSLLRLQLLKWGTSRDKQATANLAPAVINYAFSDYHLSSLSFPPYATICLPACLCP